MKNVVSFETAKALREAGFPQANPTQGQFWYDDKKRMFVICAVNKKSVDGMWIGRGTAFKSQMSDADIFAPTATDIMKELGRHFSMSIDYIGWIVRHHDLSEHGVGRHVHENPAEACALAWLEMKKK